MVKKWSVAMMVLAVSPRASALCQPGEVNVCFVNGVQGIRTCGSNGMFGTCEVPTDPSVSGKVRPGYKILTVIYAPPGRSDSGGPPSSVSYGMGSSSGTTTSSSSSFKSGTTVTTTAGATGTGIIGSASGSFGYGNSTTNSESLDIKKSETTLIGPVSGPRADGVDHDEDLIYLWLNPVLDVEVWPDGSVDWTIDPAEGMDLQYLYVKELKDPSLMPVGVAAHLASYGITTADYATMLEADPFWNGPSWIDSDRYKKVYLTFPYRPPSTPGGSIPPLTLAATYSSTSTSSTAESNEYSTSATFEGGFGFTSLMKATMKVEYKWTWTDTESLTTSTGTSESATVTVTGPSYGYTGPTSMGVYYDLLYKSFMFVPAGGSHFDGRIWGIPEHHTLYEVVATDARGDEYRAFTDVDGQFQIEGEPQYPLSLVVDDVVLEIKDETESGVDIWLGEGGPPAFEGQVWTDTDLAGFYEVTVTDADGHDFRTVADLDGLFRIYGDFTYPLTLTVDDVAVEIWDDSQGWIDVRLD